MGITRKSKIFACRGKKKRGRGWGRGEGVLRVGQMKGERATREKAHQETEKK